MLTIDPPRSWFCITALALCANTIGAVRFRAMIPAVKRGDAVAESAGGEPPALFTRTSTRPNRDMHSAITASIWPGSRHSAPPPTGAPPLDRARPSAPTICHPVRIEPRVVPDKRVTIDEIAAEVHD